MPNTFDTISLSATSKSKMKKRITLHHKVMFLASVDNALASTYPQAKKKVYWNLKWLFGVNKSKCNYI